MRSVTLVLVAAIVLMGGFYGGFKLGQNRAAASVTASPTPAVNLGGLRGGAGAGGGLAASPGAGGAGGAGGGAGGAGGAGRGVQGTITAVGANTITVHTTTGDVNVNLAPSTTINKTQTGQVSDLQKNLTVTVQGQRDSSGTVQATTITILPAGANS